MERTDRFFPCPAYYILDDLGEVLVGSRALVHVKMNQAEKSAFGTCVYAGGGQAC